MDRTHRAHLLAARVSGVFAGVGLLWIFFSDIVLEALFGVAFDRWGDVAKGAAFVLVISSLLYVLVLRTTGREIELGERLAHQSQLDAQLFLSGPEAMWVYDPATLEILEVNDTMVERYGRSREELLSLRISDLLPAEDRDTARAAVSALGPRGAPGTWRILGPDGEPHWVEVTSHAITRDGRVVRLALGRDLTERRRAEEALDASQRRLSGVLASMQEMAFSIDLVGRRIMYLNDVATDLLGADAHEHLSSVDAFLDLVAPQDRPVLLAAADEVIAKGWAEVEVRVTSPVSGDVRTLRLRGTAVTAADGTVQQIDGVAVDLTLRQELEQLVAHQRAFDQLTGLPVRIAFHAAVQAALVNTTGASTTPPMVAMFDIDRFADVNESAGHNAGDELLREVARRLLTVIEPGMVAARVGGDEFALFCPAGLAAAGDLGARLRAAVEGPYRSGSYEFFVSMGVGLAEADRDSGAEDLIRDAHLAMSAAKMRTSGIELFEPGHRAVALDRMRVDGDLRRALSAGRVVAMFQPEIDLLTHRLVAVEALVRWDDPEGGLVAARHFITEAERSNLIIEIGDVMLHHALTQAADWHRRFGAAAPVMWINLSRRELDDPAVVDRVMTAIDVAGVPVELVGMEVTETALVAEGGSVVDSLSRLAELGVALALDDFGTGWSSLQSLKAFPLTTVKIDRSFVSNVATHVEDRQIVQAIVGMAHGLSLTTLAEGVETSEQLDALIDLGCDLAQGYLLGRPAHAIDIERLIEADGTPEALRSLTG